MNIMLPISQVEYLNYKHALDDLKVVCKCHKKDQLARLQTENGRISKRSAELVKTHVDRDTWHKTVEQEDRDNYVGKIQIINSLHAKLKDFQMDSGNGGYLLAADLYNGSLKVMHAWNKLWMESSLAPSMLIQAPHTGNQGLQKLKIDAQPWSDDEKALARYFELLQKHPELKRTGELNDYTKGAYQIVYEPKEIQEIQGLVYQRLFEKTRSHQIACQGSRIGVVFEDPFWFIVRDAVISPQGFKHTYNRLIWKSQLNGTVGAAVMPLIKLPTGELKVSLVLNYRHALQSFEFELPRGGSKPGENPEETATRELKEETGYHVEKPRFLGAFPPDSGVMASIVPVFLGKVSLEETAKQEKTEAIKGKYLFSIEEVRKALLSQDKCLEVTIGNEKKWYPVRDPFLIFALLMLQLDEQ